VEKNGIKDPRIQHLLEEDDKLLKLIASEKNRRITDEKDKLNNSDIDKWQQTADKRRILFGDKNN